MISRPDSLSPLIASDRPGPVAHLVSPEIVSPSVTAVRPSVAGLRILRFALGTTVLVNVFGAILFGLAALGRPPALLPRAIPPVYAAQLAWVIALFAGVYFHLARAEVINRPLLLVGALGKLGFFVLFGLYAAGGALPWQVVVNASPDLILGATFAVWLWANRRSASALAGK